MHAFVKNIPVERGAFITNEQAYQWLFQQAIFESLLSLHKREGGGGGGGCE